LRSDESASGSPCFPLYGGERTVTNTCTQNNYKFEGKERDTETGNDDFGARDLPPSSAHGIIRHQNLLNS